MIVLDAGFDRAGDIQRRIQGRGDIEIDQGQAEQVTGDVVDRVAGFEKINADVCTRDYVIDRHVRRNARNLVTQAVGRLKFEVDRAAREGGQRRCNVVVGHEVHRHWVDGGTYTAAIRISGKRVRLELSIVTRHANAAAFVVKLDRSRQALAIDQAPKNHVGVGGVEHLDAGVTVGSQEQQAIDRRTGNRSEGRCLHQIVGHEVNRGGVVGCQVISRRQVMIIGSGKVGIEDQRVGRGLPVFDPLQVVRGARIVRVQDELGRRRARRGNNDVVDDQIVSRMVLD